MVALQTAVLLAGAAVLRAGSVVLVEANQRAVVQFAQPFLVHHFLPLGQGVGQCGGLQPHILCQFTHQAHILELQDTAASRGEAAFDHALAVELQNAALGKAAQQGLAHEGRVNAAALGQVQGLSHCVNGLGHDELVGQFGDLPTAAWSHVGDAAAQHLQQRQGTLEVLMAASGHDGEAGGLSPHLSTRNGCIQPGLLGSEAARGFHGSGAHVHNQGIGVQAFVQAAWPKNHLLDYGSGGEVDEDHPRANLLGQRGKVGRAGHAHLGCALKGGGAAVPDQHLGAGLVQVTGIGAAHVAQSDKSQLVSLQRIAHALNLAALGRPWQPSFSFDPTMRVLITGGGGFLGHQLAQELLRLGQFRGRALSELILLDRAFGRELAGSGLRRVCGDVARPGWVREAAQGPVDVIFHLASMVSGECEEDFDAALRVNLDGGREVFAAARASGPDTVLVFASSIACYGGLDMSLPMDDFTKHLPQTTYGMTKAMGEMLVNDHSRKGHFDGRSVRLPTVVIRPGRPNAAASSWASGMFREPLNGEDCRLPISVDQPHPMTDDLTVVQSLLACAQLPAEALGVDRALVLPAHRVTPREAMQAVKAVGARLGIRLGRWDLQPDARIAAIVARWPQQVDGARAMALGMPQPMALEAIVERFVRTFGVLAPPSC